MKYEERRREAGKMLIDISKYFLIGGIVFVIFGEKFNLVIAIEIFVIAIVAFLAGFYIIPPKQNKK